jgi:hypothetical protein
MYGDTNAMVHREVFQAVGGFPEDFGYALEVGPPFFKIEVLQTKLSAVMYTQETNQPDAYICPSLHVFSVATFIVVFLYLCVCVCVCVLYLYVLSV